MRDADSSLYWTLLILASHFIAFVLLFLWPALKTYAALTKGIVRSRMLAYWIGISVIYAIWSLIRFFVEDRRLYPLFIVVSSFVLSAVNGAAPRFLSQSVRSFYEKHCENIELIPNYVLNGVGQLLSMFGQFVDLVKALFGNLRAKA